MENDALYDLVLEAVKQALAEESGGDLRVHRRLAGGTVVFRDAEGKFVKEVPVGVLFRKLTAIREKLRVMEQKLNNHPGLSDEEKAELQNYLTRAYGSMTTFNFLFREEEDKFKGTGGDT